jgi:hypothetical protein
MSTTILAMSWPWRKLPTLAKQCSDRPVEGQRFGLANLPVRFQHAIEEIVRLLDVKDKVRFLDCVGYLWKRGTSQISERPCHR